MNKSCHTGWFYHTPLPRSSYRYLSFGLLPQVSPWLLSPVSTPSVQCVPCAILMFFLRYKSEIWLCEPFCFTVQELCRVCRVKFKPLHSCNKSLFRYICVSFIFCCLFFSLLQPNLLFSSCQFFFWPLPWNSFLLLPLDISYSLCRSQSDIIQGKYAAVTQCFPIFLLLLTMPRESKGQELLSYLVFIISPL